MHAAGRNEPGYRGVTRRDKNYMPKGVLSLNTIPLQPRSNSWEVDTCQVLRPSGGYYFKLRKVRLTGFQNLIRNKKNVLI